MLLVFDPLTFFFRTRLDYLNSTLALLFELCNPYLLTVLANISMLHIYQLTDECSHKSNWQIC